MQSELWSTIPNLFLFFPGTPVIVCVEFYLERKMENNGPERLGIHTTSGTATIQETITRTDQKKQLLVLKLREKRVKWDESAVNNEFMGKKSSKRKQNNVFSIYPLLIPLFPHPFRLLYISQEKAFW